MKKRKPPKSPLRKRAEARLADRVPARSGILSAAEARRLLHELEVHQVELEMQNEELRASREEVEAGFERYSELFDFAPIGYAAIEDGGTITAVNHAGAQLLGRARSLLTRGHFTDLIAVRDRSTFEAVLALVRGGMPKATCELELSVQSEPTTVVRLTATMLRATFLLAFVDITDERRKNAQLAEAERELRAQDARKDQFLAMLSHELRNPLTPIRASLHLLDRDAPDSAVAKKAREVIDRQVTHLTHIVDDLLDVTRITHGKVRLRRARFDFGALVRSVLEDRRAIFEETGIALSLEAPDDPLDVDADATRLNQVISNLLGNAHKFTPPGGRVDLTLQRADGRVELRVRDTGAGITEAMLEHVFEPFHQAPQTLDRSIGGLGLGLAMVKGIVELHQGTVEIASPGPGRGTEVIVRLPLADGAGAAVMLPSGGGEPPRRVVLIEDNHDTADGLGRVLSLRGHEVHIAYDGPSGLDVVRRFHPEVVICDLGLPGIDGYSLAKMLRGDSAIGPLFLISFSGYAQPEDLQRAAAAGFDRHIAKPPDLDALARVIAEAPAHRMA
jgi:two-component system CheB/CheR fusion protein